MTETLLENNQRWAQRMQDNDPDFFPRLARQQAPRYLWIGCSDSRVPASEIVGLMPGELFVHRNIANLVVHSDLNCLSVLQFAIEVLKVEHVIVCGHYGCGGVQAVLDGQRHGLIDNWLQHIRDVRDAHRDALERVAQGDRLRLLCELNVIEQVRNVARTSVVQDAWERGQTLTVHGWIYGLKDGRLRDLSSRVTGPDDEDQLYKAALARL